MTRRRSCQPSVRPRSAVDCDSDVAVPVLTAQSSCGADGGFKPWRTWTWIGVLGAIVVAVVLAIAYAVWTSKKKGNGSGGDGGDGGDGRTADSSDSGNASRSPTSNPTAPTPQTAADPEVLAPQAAPSDPVPDADPTPAGEERRDSEDVGVRDGVGNDRADDVPDAQDTVVVKPHDAPSVPAPSPTDTVVDAPVDAAAGQASSAASTSAAASGTAAGTLGASAAVAAVPVLNVLAALVPR
jgi:hypothetical protein